MKYIPILGAFVGLLAIGAIACNGSNSDGDGDSATSPPAQMTEAPSTDETDDEEEIRDLFNAVAKAFSREDWAGGYELYAPSIRETCLKGKFLAATVIATVFAKGFIGEEAWEAIKDDMSDGYEIQSIKILENRAVATALELDSEEELVAVKEDGRWWFYEEAPCETDIFGTEDSETNECLDAYNRAVEEWNALYEANDSVYQQYTIGGEIGTGFEGWAEDNGYAADFCPDE